MFKPYTRYYSQLKTIRDDIQRLQNNIEDAFRDILNKAHLDSFVIEDAYLSPSVDNLVVHKLGKEVKGWHILSPDAPAMVSENKETTEDKTKYLVLNTSFGVNCDIVVFK